MLIIASLSMVLAAAPSFTESTREERFQGALIAQADLPPPAPVVGADVAALQAELEQLRSHRPGLGLPIGLLVGGGAAIIAGIVLMAVSWPFIGIVIGLPFVVLGALVGIAGVVLTIVGVAVLPGRIQALNKHRERERELEAQLQAPAATSRTMELMPGVQVAVF